MLDDRLGDDGGFVDGAVAEVDDLFGMVQRPGGVGTATLVSGVGGSAGVVQL